jgi:hypothetical protein
MYLYALYSSSIMHIQVTRFRRSPKERSLKWWNLRFPTTITKAGPYAPYALLNA